MPKQSKTDFQVQQAFCFLAQGLSCREVAARLGVTQRTVERWRKAQKPLAAVQATIEKSGEKPASSLTVFESGEFEERLLGLLSESLNCLQEILRNPDARIADRVRVCQILGDWGGLSRGSACQSNRAIELLSREGYLVVDPADLERPPLTTESSREPLGLK